MIKSTPKFKILIADDHGLVRRGLSKILLESGVASEIMEAENGKEAIDLGKSFDPDIYVIDYDMPIYNGIYVCERLKATKEKTPILMVSMYDSKMYIMEAVRAGVKGFIPKESTAEELVGAIVAVASGETWFKGAIAEVIVKELTSDRPKRKSGDGSELTSREFEVLRLFADGKSSQEISEHLKITRRTVQVHKANIYKKLGVHNTAELIRYAMNNLK